ncbi:MAG TPA: ADP-forming succinate--CoA ligase subunit beta [bacterium]|nr:ADP-forming succinate--CoA ligase subunit beta [bacterium]HMW33800.1 ADP-forming succinate--CoA ligase subunit beta [bacterium]HMZ04728.1 ADP-forming succinate--CoA ligase subunit beta [bacterium]HNB56263.1 ADP-forming succinate--CoA ligase subunit beta [bacterium]HNC47856.1 ADP-forming succinate--CoA ligase subunit beta [bacterium]
MNIHEYQGKAILKKYGVPIQEGIPAATVTEAIDAAKTLKAQGIGAWVVKAQIHAGGRGKGTIYKAKERNEVVQHGGVKFTPDINKVAEYAEKMLGNVLVTHQTGDQGKLIKKVLVAEGLDIAKELYVGLVLDRARSQYVMMASTEGGVEIEKVAEEHPEKIIKEYVDPTVGFRAFQAQRLGFALGLEGDIHKNFVKFAMALYDAFIGTDSSLFEINPLVITKDNRVVALDAKINFDDNALYRHPDLAALRDIDEEDPLEVEASKYNLNYVKLDGNVGCMVNGAGLAMATMDIIKLAGANPANFLDVGGGANPQTVENGFKIILSDPHVKAIFINIFGGIVRCDRIANGVVQAAKNVNIRVPLIVRLKGTNAEEAKEILRKSGIPMLVANELNDAADMILQAVKKN